MNGKLTAYQLKIIAIAAMTIDHIAWLFLDSASPAGIICHFIGRLTAPTMCYFIAEGYHYTRDRKKYLIRLAVFALISAPAFNYFKTGSMLPVKSLGMIYTLCLGCAVLYVNDSDALSDLQKMGFMIMAVAASMFGDWQGIAVVWVLIFHRFRDDPRRDRIYLLSSAVYLALLAADKLTAHTLGVAFTYNLGIFAAVLLMRAYGGELGGKKSFKYFFYVYYPLHMAAIRFIYTLYNKGR